VLRHYLPGQAVRQAPCKLFAAEIDWIRFLLQYTYAIAFVHGGTFAGVAFPQHTNLPTRKTYSREGRLPWQRVPAGHWHCHHRVRAPTLCLWLADGWSDGHMQPKRTPHASSSPAANAQPARTRCGWCYAYTSECMQTDGQSSQSPTPTYAGTVSTTW
jgi:hypothetical protein